MRKIIPYIIKLSAVLIVLSVVGQQVSATKSDVERALELLKQARAAIGGESTIGAVQNLVISGKSSRQVQLPNQGSTQLTGEFELSMILPDQLIRIEKMTMGTPDSNPSVENSDDKSSAIKDVRVKVIRDVDSPTSPHTARQKDQSEIARYMLGLLLTPPPTFVTSYDYAGEGNVDGARADIIETMGSNGFTMKLFLDKSSHLPLMMSYKGSLPRMALDRDLKAGQSDAEGEGKDVIIIRHLTADGTDRETPNVVFERKLDDGEPTPKGHKIVISDTANDDAEIQVHFSNFRMVGGVSLPHKLTHFVNGTLDTVWTVESYEINSPNINDRHHRAINVTASGN